MQQPLHTVSPKGAALVRAIAGEAMEVPDAQISSDACWVDRAIVIYKHSLSCNFTPTLKVLNKLFACLRKPRSKPLTDMVFTPFNMAAHHLHEIQQLQGRKESSEGGTLDIFDRRLVVERVMSRPPGVLYLQGLFCSRTRRSE